MKVLAPMGLVCRDAYILLKLMRSLEPVDLLVDKVGFELAGTPADPDTRPAVAVGRDAQPRTVFQAGRFLLGFLKHHVLETLWRTQGGDVQAALSEQVLVHLGDMPVHLRELHAGVCPQHRVNGQAALNHQQQEAGGILAPTQADGVKIFFGYDKSAHLRARLSCWPPSLSYSS